MQTLSDSKQAYLFDACLGCRIFTLFNCYENEYSFIQNWVAENNDKITACISIMSGVATITACEDCDFEELIYFLINDSTIDYIETNEFIGEKINKYLNAKTKTRPIMMFSGEHCDFTPNFPIYSSVIKESFSVITQSDKNFEGTDFPSWFYDSHKRIRSGFCNIYAIKDNEKFVSTAGYYVSSPNSALVSSVATLPSYRNKGYASNLVEFVTQEILNMGKKPYLLAANDDLISFYENLGYIKIGTEHLIYLKNTDR